MDDYGVEENEQYEREQLQTKEEIKQVINPKSALNHELIEAKFKNILESYSNNSYNQNFEEFNQSFDFLRTNIRPGMGKRLLNTKIDFDFLLLMLDFIDGDIESLKYTGITMISKLCFYLNPFFNDELRNRFIQSVKPLFNISHDFTVSSLCAISNLIDLEENSADSYFELKDFIINSCSDKPIENEYQLFTIKNLVLHCSPNLIDYPSFYPFLIHHIIPADPETGDFPSVTTYAIYSIFYSLKTEDSINFLQNTIFPAFVNDLLANSDIQVLYALLGILIKSKELAKCVDFNRILKLLHHARREISSRAAFLMSLFIDDGIDYDPSEYLEIVIELVMSSKSSYEDFVSYTKLLASMFGKCTNSILLQLNSIREFVEYSLSIIQSGNSELSIPLLKCLTYLHQAVISYNMLTYFHSILDDCDCPQILRDCSEPENEELSVVLNNFIENLEHNGYPIFND